MTEAELTQTLRELREMADEFEWGSENIPLPVRYLTDGTPILEAYHTSYTARLRHMAYVCRQAAKALEEGRDGQAT